MFLFPIEQIGISPVALSFQILRLPWIPRQKTDLVLILNQIHNLAGILGVVCWREETIMEENVFFDRFIMLLQGVQERYELESIHDAMIMWYGEYWDNWEEPYWYMGPCCDQCD